MRRYWSPLGMIQLLEELSIWMSYYIPAELAYFGLEWRSLVPTLRCFRGFQTMYGAYYEKLISYELAYLRDEKQET